MGFAALNPSYEFTTRIPIPGRVRRDHHIIQRSSKRHRPGVDFGRGLRAR
jgi:hypothetical protein